MSEIVPQPLRPARKAPFSDPNLGWVDKTLLHWRMGARDAWVARPEDPRDARALRIVNELSQKKNIPAPQVIIYQSEKPNAASLNVSGNVAISTDLLRIMPDDQLSAVVGHELAHHGHRARDAVTAIAVSAAWLVSYCMLLRPKLGRRWPEFIGAEKWTKKSTVGWLAENAGWVAGDWMLNAGLRRQNEFEADHESAQLTDNPKAMADSLKTLRRRGLQLKAEHEEEQLEDRGKLKGWQRNVSDVLHHIDQAWIAPVRRLLRKPFAVHPPLSQRMANMEALALEEMPFSQPQPVPTLLEAKAHGARWQESVQNRDTQHQPSISH